MQMFILTHPKVFGPKAEDEGTDSKKFGKSRIFQSRDLPVFTKDVLEELHLETRKHYLNFYQTETKISGNILGDKESVYSGPSGIEMSKVREFVP